MHGATGARRQAVEVVLLATLGVTALTACAADEGPETAEEPAAETSSSAEPDEESSPAEGSSTPSDSPSSEASPSAAPELPECSEVWVAGVDLPERYRGCVTDGAKVRDVRHFCETGLPIFEHGGRYYAVRGGPVNDVGDTSTSQQFQRALKSCRG